MEHAIRFVPRFFEFSRSRSRIISKRTLRSRFCTCNEQRSITIVDRPCAFSFRDLVLFFSFFYFFDLRLASLEPRFKFQRALRSKKEVEEARQTVTKRAATNGFSFFGFCLSPKNGKSLLLFCHCARFSM